MTDFDPSNEPGGQGAVTRGCTCPVIDNHHGKGARGEGKAWFIDPTCSIHGDMSDAAIDEDYVRE